MKLSARQHDGLIEFIATLLRRAEVDFEMKTTKPGTVVIRIPKPDK